MQFLSACRTSSVSFKHNLLASIYGLDLYSLSSIYQSIHSIYFHFLICKCILTYQLPVCTINNCDLLVYCSLLFCGLLLLLFNWLALRPIYDLFSLSVFIVAWYMTILSYCFHLLKDISLCFYNYMFYLLHSFC